MDNENHEGYPKLRYKSEESAIEVYWKCIRQRAKVDHKRARASQHGLKRQ